MVQLAIVLSEESEDHIKVIFTTLFLKYCVYNITYIMLKRVDVKIRVEASMYIVINGFLLHYIISEKV